MKRTYTNSNGKELNFNKKILFNISLILLPIILIVLTEFFLRIFGYGNDLSLFKKSNIYKGYLEINQKVGKRYFTRLASTKSSNDIFLSKKPDSCYRVFVMGSSTAIGFPYEIGISFSRILNSRLQDAFPHKRIEIVNTAMTAVNSYTLLDLTNEILKQKPDAIIIYAGHNEYYGALGVGSVENGGNLRWLKLIHIKLMRYRLYQLIQNFINAILKRSSSGSNSRPTGTLMERIAKEKSIAYGSKMYYSGIEQFRENIEELLKRTTKAGVPVIISEVVSNVHDIKPFKSIASNKYPKADEVYENARQLEAEGKYDQARKAYYEAKDLDAIRFRASEDINNIIHELGNKYKILVVPMKSYFEQHSQHGFIGDNLMIEHLHPNVDGYFLMADAFFNTMRQAKMIDYHWDTTIIHPSSYYRNNWGFTSIDSLVSDLTVKKLKAGWPFQSDTVVNMFKYNYKPVSFEDSMAFLCVKYNNVRIESIHQKMAKYYADKSEFYNAYKEYYSLIKCYPNRNEPYIEACNYLLLAKKYNQACELLKSMPESDTTYYALFQIGMIYAKQKEFIKAISYFEKAKRNYKGNGSNVPLLISIYNAYIGAGYKEKAENLASKISKIDPQFNQSKSTIPNVHIIFLSEKAKKYVNDAKILANEGNLDKALELLYKANEIDESSYINLFIGTILYQKKDTLALYFLEKAYKDIPNDPSLLDKLFIIYIAKRDFIKASKILNEYKLISRDKSRIQRLTRVLEKMKR